MFFRIPGWCVFFQEVEEHFQSFDKLCFILVLLANVTFKRIPYQHK
jgi:hypothetical protein